MQRWTKRSVIYEVIHPPVSIPELEEAEVGGCGPVHNRVVNSLQMSSRFKCTICLMNHIFPLI